MIAVVAVAAVIGFTGYQAMQARDALNQANAQLATLTQAVTTGDATAAQQSLYDMQKATLTAQRNTGGPAWWLASKAPIIGNDVTAVRTVTDVVDDVAQVVLPRLVDASASLSPTDLQPVDDRIRLGGIERVAPMLVTAHRSLVDDVAQVEALNPDALMQQIASPVNLLKDKLAKAASLTDSASKAAKLIPPMLGADGKRTYLMLFQNNAEIRATGGIPGAITTLTADRGVITLGKQGSAGLLGSYDKPVLPLTAAERQLFTDNLGIYPADITFTPNFPRTAQLAQAMWQGSTGQTLDGVLSADPVALSYLLKGTGPITPAGGQELTAGNAVQVLLNQIYLDQPNPELQNAFFADAARQGFASVMSGQGNPRAVFDGIIKAVKERRILLWSDHPKEESQLAQTPLSGALPTARSSSPQVGVYLNDGTGAKMDYYLDYDVAVASSSCSSTDVQTLRVTVTMTSTAPADAGSLPVSAVGPGFGAPAGSIRTNVLVYAPIGGGIRHATIDGKPLISASSNQAGRPVAAQTVDLTPGQSHKLKFSVTSGVHQPGTPEVITTPGLPGKATTHVAASACR